MTRTLVVGTSSERQREIYETVLTAYLTSIDKVLYRAQGADIHHMAAESIEKVGYGEYVTHGLGYGVGPEVHEVLSLVEQVRIL